MTATERSRVRADAGALAGELAILAPALIVLMVFVVFVGRLGQARHDVTQAVAEAARVATLERDADVGTLTRQTVARNLAAAGVECRALAITVDGLPARAGDAVAVTARCDVDLTDVAGLGLPRSSAIEATAVEVVDTYRGAGR